jgi:hypothetical protein
MPSLTTLLIIWGAITAVLVLLLIYRSTLTIHEDDQLFINDSESHMAVEQKELLQKIEGLTPYVRLFGVGSGVMAVVVFGMWIWQGLNQQ